MSKEIVFLVPYPVGESPSQRFRFEQYFQILEQKGHPYRVQSFLDSKTWRVFYQSGKIIRKSFAILKGFDRRFRILFKLTNVDFVFIHREAAPIGPPVVEWIIAKILRKKIIYDFDDAIWMTDHVSESAIAKMIRWRSKVRSICTWSYKVSCGNEYLCTFAQHYNSTVVYNPTTIDTVNLHNSKKIKPIPKKKLTVGWTGSHSTLKYLKTIEPSLVALEQKYPQIEILIIANQKPDLNLKSLRFLPWKIETETEDLAKIDIGIMPLPDDEWTKGKCGFKALQYMAMGIPTVASAVGVNATLVDHGINGFLATTQQNWLEFLSRLIEDPSLCKKMGEAGRIKVTTNYSVSSNTVNFLSLFL